MKRLKALLVLALGMVLTVPAFAETQNVKVSGAIDMYGFHRNNYDLNKDGGSSTNAGGSSADEYFRTNTQLEVSADLTDNVSTVVNLVNQRHWADSGTAATATPDDDSLSVNLDLAYVQMKEIFYSPLTLSLGRQDIWFGRGFIIGTNSHAWDPDGTLSADEYAVTTAFDAIRATLDFNPWTLDLVYSKISEGNAALDINSENDLDLYALNVNYKFAEYNAVAEGYYVLEYDSANPTDQKEGADTNTIGGRVQFDPISQITLGAEVAYQFGDYRDTGTLVFRDRGAWALDLFGTYHFDYTWKPALTLEYVYFSGEEQLSDLSDADYGSWNALYRGKFWTAYGDFRQFLYATDDPSDQPATTNQQFFQVKVEAQPFDDLLLLGSLTFFWTAEDVHVGPTTLGSQDYLASSTMGTEIGWEADFQATYDYTEDVSFGLLAGWFIPGDFYNGPSDVTATDVVSSVKVTF